MPFARLTIAAPETSPQTCQQLVTGLTTLLEQDLLKEPEVTVVHTALVPPDSWYVAASHQAGTTGALLEVSITAGTNTAQERTTFIHHAHELLADTLGTLPAATYVTLHEPDAESYGYNGVTQLARRRLEAS